MKNIIIASAVILLITVGLFVAKNNSGDTLPNNKFQEITAQIETGGAQLIDVREPSEYALNHADGAINVPLGDIVSGNLSKINKSKPVYVYCKSGKRAEKAKIALENAGYKDVTNLGGLSNWQDQGGLVCKSNESNC